MQEILREITNTNWITLLFISSMSLLATARLLNPIRFLEFIMLFASDKYIILQAKNKRVSNIFSLSLTSVQILSVSLFIYLFLTSFSWYQEANPILLFIQTAVIYMLFKVSKILIEKIIGVIFSAEILINDYIFHKLSYHNFFGLILLPINLILVYTIKPSTIVLIFIGILLIISNLIILFSVYRKHQTIIYDNLFYFILYLCALEIAPYFILYKLFTM